MTTTIAIRRRRPPTEDRTNASQTDGDERSSDLSPPPPTLSAITPPPPTIPQGRGVEGKGVGAEKKGVPRVGGQRRPMAADSMGSEVSEATRGGGRGRVTLQVRKAGA